jgi:DNA-binding NarL/FixJ family response regulator
MQTEATAWVELAKKERAAHARHWGRQGSMFGRERPKKKDERKRVGSYNPKRLALVKEMVEEGFRTVDIANELKISESSVRYWKKYYNLG